MPSTRIIRRSFFVPSSVSPVARDFEVALGWLRSLLKEWAVAADICLLIHEPLPLSCPLTNRIEQLQDKIWTFRFIPPEQ